MRNLNFRLAGHRFPLISMFMFDARGVGGKSMAPAA
jgi:hypothetical protein